MLKKINSIIIVTTIFLTAGGCLTVSRPGISSIYEDMKSTRGFISRAKGNTAIIKKKKTGETGFYYIIDLDGTVLYHPRGLLVGSNFSRYRFVKRIIEKRSGCISYYAGEIQQLIFFLPLNEESILCLSIPADEVKDSESACSRIQP